jgi:hypothetical protein
VNDKYGVYQYFYSPASPFIEDHYHALQPRQITFGRAKNNFILILLESIEETFNNKEFFNPPLMPELGQLRNEYNSFYGYQAAHGSEWTIAALCNYFLGIPLKLPYGFDGNSYDGKHARNFLPGALSIFEALEYHDYKIDFFLGSNAKFSGKDNLFNSHSRNATIHDLPYFESTRDDASENMGTDWGVSDYYVYERAKEFLTANHNNGSFFIIIETVDTHLPQGYVAVDKGFPVQYQDVRDCHPCG